MSSTNATLVRVARMVVLAAAVAALFSCGGTRANRSYVAAPAQTAPAPAGVPADTPIDVTLLDSSASPAAMDMTVAVDDAKPTPPVPVMPQPLVPIDASTVPTQEPVLPSPVPPVDIESTVAVESTAALEALPSPAAAAVPPAPIDTVPAAVAAEPVAPAPAPAAPAAEASSGRSLSAEELYLEAVRAGARSDAGAEVQQRISYPDDLFGGAIVRSSEKPGWVTMYYPLRSAGGVSVT